VGANCGGLGIDDYTKVAEEMAAASPLPVLIQPNAGQPALKDGQPAYDLTPEQFAQGLKRCAEAGARLLGGCCGTSPAHIQALRAVISGQ